MARTKAGWLLFAAVVGTGCVRTLPPTTPTRAPNPEPHTIRDAGDLDAVPLGRAFDSATGALLIQTCVEPLGKAVPAPLFRASSDDKDCSTGFQKQNLQVHYSRTYSRMAELLQLDMSAHVRLGAGGASASAQYLSGRSSQSNQIVLAVENTVATKTELVKEGWRIKDRFAKLKPDEFRKQCGTGFVGVRTIGGLYRALYNWESSASEARLRRAASGEGHSATWQASVTAVAELQKLAGSETVTANLVRSGGQALVNALSPDEAIKQAMQFACGVKGDHVGVIEYQTYDYSTIGAPVTPEDSAVLRALGKAYMRLEEDFNNTMLAQRVFDEMGRRIPECKDQIVRVRDYGKAVAQRLSEFQVKYSACSSKTPGACDDAFALANQQDPEIGGGSSQCVAPGCEATDALGFCARCRVHGSDSANLVCSGFSPGDRVLVKISGTQTLSMPNGCRAFGNWTGTRFGVGVPPSLLEVKGPVACWSNPGQFTCSVTNKWSSSYTDTHDSESKPVVAAFDGIVGQDGRVRVLLEEKGWVVGGGCKEYPRDPDSRFDLNVQVCRELRCQ